MQTNPRIPNTMSHKGLEFLARIAASVKPGNSILEAGSLYGCTAWVFSKNAPRDVKVYAIDPWEEQKFLRRFRMNNLRAPALSEHAFKAYTHDCENLIAVKGYSPAAAEALALDNLDVVFEDAAHNYDVLKQNIDYFYPRLNKGGIICGDDYSGSFPGVIRGVNELAEAIGVKPFVSGQVWAIRKPDPDSDADQSLYARLGPLYANEIGVRLETVSGNLSESDPQCFTPNLFKPEKLKTLSLFWKEQTESNLSFYWQLRFADGSKSKKFAPADICEIDGRDVIGMRVQLKGSGKGGYHVGYQMAQARSEDDDVVGLGPYREKFNGGWLTTTQPGFWMYSFNVSLVTSEVRKMRSEHSTLKKLGREVGEKLFGEKSQKPKKKLIPGL